MTWDPVFLLVQKTRGKEQGGAWLDRGRPFSYGQGSLYFSTNKSLFFDFHTLFGNKINKRNSVNSAPSFFPFSLKLRPSNFSRIEYTQATLLYSTLLCLEKVVRLTKKDCTLYIVTKQLITMLLPRENSSGPTPNQSRI